MLKIDIYLQEWQLDYPPRQISQAIKTQEQAMFFSVFLNFGRYIDVLWM